MKTENDYRSRLYQRYASEQMSLDVETLRKTLAAGLPYYRQLVQRHVPHQRNARILDLGCGYGPLLHELKRAGYTNFSGIDTSPEQVKVAQELGLSCVQQGDLLGHLAQTEDSSHDVIAAIDVIEHFSKEEIVLLLDQIHRVLKPNGSLLLHVPNGEAIFAGKIFFGDFTHQTAFTHKSIRQVALACGFASIECFEDKPVPHGVLSALRSALWWLVRTKFRFMNAIETGEAGKDLILSQNLLAVCRK